MKGALGDLMRQAQKMQTDLQDAQDEIAKLEVVGEAGAGMVRVTMTGRHDVKKLEIDTALMEDEKEMLQDLIAAAINDANRRLEAVSKDRLSGLATGLNLPSGFKLPF